MKYLLIILLSAICGKSISQNTSAGQPEKTSPLSAYSAEWNKPEYYHCNTAATAGYMTDKEREVVYILNLARSYPKLFANTVLAKYPSLSGKEQLINNKYYYQSLISTMLAMASAPLLNANEKCYQSAECHAKASGETGYTGHDRLNAACKAKRYFLGECCYYGDAEPINIVLSLLIDEDVPSLGHRKIILGNYSSVGVSIQPHKTYRQNAVIDFYN